MIKIRKVCVVPRSGNVFSIYHHPTPDISERLERDSYDPAGTIPVRIKDYQFDHNSREIEVTVRDAFGEGSFYVGCDPTTTERLLVFKDLKRRQP